ncbi:MAG: hypothetical protein L0332_07105 [Chloroflexi bacterium]|nr:hypothetical protein [Chloroflexota bacterium]MCI0575695.1 hypothetical protein [Chloroflexota bacterium]MCI0648037.1 hypothetical protein [Chloroflexota bacterium]MCI0726477.1 hypothetical protein [Chloroflexota bacterium]
MKKSSLVSVLSVVVGLWGLVGCGQPAILPTRIPTAALPTPLPTDTPTLPPTRDLDQPVDTSSTMPTVVLPTRRPTATPEPLPAAINITSPGEGIEFLLGSQVIIGGLVQMAPTNVLSVTLISATGHRLAGSPAEVGEFNSWQATLNVPQSVNGTAQVQAALYDAQGVLLALDVLGVKLALDTASTDRYMALFRPLNGENAAAGYNLFFDGRVQAPVGNQVTVSLWSQGCQTQVARETYTLSGSGYWWGLLLVPRDASGPACAVAHFGTQGEETWREAQVVVNILPAADDNAQAVQVGSPRPGSTIVAGQELLLYGTAYNAANREVFVSILLENGRILAEGIATVNIYGYWELTLFIVPDAEGPAQINVFIGNVADENYAQNQTLVTIVAGEGE